jgi:hypothetical protein
MLQAPARRARLTPGAEPLGEEAGGLASRAGSLARRLLGQAGRGRVLAAVTGAIYLRASDGEILWIQGRDAPMHRRGVELAAAAVPRVAEGALFRVDGGMLRVDPSIRIDLRGAAPWKPGHVEPGASGSPGEIAVRIRELFGAIDTAGARELGSLIPTLRAIFDDGMVAPTETGDPVVDAAAPHVIGAALACRERDAIALKGHARALVGLGRGLTPSGDDFVGALLFVLRRVPGERSQSFAQDACAEAWGWADRTNAISFALLVDHAAGHGNAFEHEIVSGLFAADPVAGLRTAVGRLVRIGHSSGWDQLAGMVAALSGYRESA